MKLSDLNIISIPCISLGPVGQKDYDARALARSGKHIPLNGVWYRYQEALSQNSARPFQSIVAPHNNYKHTKASILFFSGGIESWASVILAKRRGIDLDIINVDPNSLSKEQRLEGLFAIAGADMGYTNVFIGIEGEPSVTCQPTPITPSTIEYTPEFWSAWSRYSGSTLNSLVYRFNRLELTRLLYQQDIDWDNVVSCIHATLQDPTVKCGECFKCVVNWMTVDALRLPIRMPPPSTSAQENLRQEIAEYRRTGADHFLNMGYFEYLPTFWGVGI